MLILNLLGCSIHGNIGRWSTVLYCLLNAYETVSLRVFGEGTKFYSTHVSNRYTRCKAVDKKRTISFRVCSEAPYKSDTFLAAFCTLWRTNAEYISNCISWSKISSCVFCEYTEWSSNLNTFKKSNYIQRWGLPQWTRRVLLLKKVRVKNNLMQAYF